MSNLREFYKVDQLHAEIRELKKKITGLGSDNKKLIAFTSSRSTEYLAFTKQKLLPEAKGK